MKKVIITLLLIAFANASLAGYPDRVRAYVEQAGYEYQSPEMIIIGNPDKTGPRILKWKYELEQPTEADLPTEEEAQVHMAAAKAADEAVRQAAKPAERKAYETAFYTLTQQVLVDAADPRANDESTPKLGFSELQAIIEVIQVADPITAITYSLKLLSIDSALKRYDPLWWEDAIIHE